MSPILGIMASQNYPRVTNSYESIATVTVGAGGSSTVTFSSIPSTYKHLQIRAIARSDRATSLDSMFFYANADTTTSNYYAHGLYGTGSAVGAYADNSNFFSVGVFPGTSATSGMFGGSVIDVLDYANTSKNKVSRTLNGADLNGSGQVRLLSSLWMSTTAINSITFTTNGGGNFVQYSSFALYGVR